MTDRYAVLGNPVEHSLSPQIHAHFAAQTGEDIAYGRLRAEPDDFAGVATRFFSDGGKGLNVTVPFKQDAFRFADELSPRARQAQAVNTLLQHGNGHCEGENTDGVGLLRDLTVNHGLRLGEMRILLLGAGGAVRGVLAPLLEQNPLVLVIANRSADKAASLAQHFAPQGVVRGIGFGQTEQYAPYDLIINGTSAGLSGETPALPQGILGRDACAYDMLYAAELTPFLRWADGQGVARRWDGFGMLVEQAAESFCLWRGQRPDTGPVIQALRP